ncbi:MAG: hypothetical protein AAF988_07935 [Pseudomonadota bacterium]
MTLLKKKQNNNGLAASVSEGYLVLSLPHAIEPVVWRQSLEKIGSALFEIKSGKDDAFNLVLKKTKTTSDIIASFEDKEEAIDALNAASNALHSKKTVRINKPAPKTNNDQNDEASPKSSSNEGQKWLVALLAAIIVIGMYYYLTTLMPDRTFGVGVNTAAQAGASSSNPNQTGVPVSADDFLNSFQ